MNKPILLSRATEHPDQFEITLLEPLFSTHEKTDPYYFKDFVGDGYLKITGNERAIMNQEAFENVVRNFGMELDQIIHI